MSYTIDHLPEWQCWKKRVLDPTVIIIHFISAVNTHPDNPYEVKYIREILEDYGFSAHLLIDREGNETEMVPLAFQAWHAGKSQFRTMTNLNKHAIGIEVVGRFDDDFEEEQYQTLAERLVSLMERYNIDTNHIKGHEQISGPKVRDDYKVDPGIYFNWIKLGKYMERIYE